MDKLLRIAQKLVMEKSPVLTLVIGLPGSGKSTFAKTIPNASHYEADMYFIDDGGRYNFDASRLKQAHEWCQDMTERDLKNGRDVVVSNTGLSLWEREQYYSIAVKCGAAIRVRTMMNDYGNIHGVPAEALDAMKRRFQPVTQTEIDEYGIEVL